MPRLMPKEIERKFLVKGESWREGASSSRYRQGYLCSSEQRTVRVRVAKGKGFLTIKGPSVGASRDEYEYEIPLSDAEAMLDSLCERPFIEKTRHVVMYEGLRWEIDEFEGENQGLVMAEVVLWCPAPRNAAISSTMSLSSTGRPSISRLATCVR